VWGRFFLLDNTASIFPFVESFCPFTFFRLRAARFIFCSRFTSDFLSASFHITIVCAFPFFQMNTFTRSHGLAGLSPHYLFLSVFPGFSTPLFQGDLDLFLFSLWFLFFLLLVFITTQDTTSYTLPFHGSYV